MRRVCLALPTNRACAGTITALAEEAAHAAAHFDVEVHLLILDTSDGSGGFDRPGTFDGSDRSDTSVCPGTSDAAGAPEAAEGSGATSFARNAAAVAALAPAPRVVVHHLDEAWQRAFLERVIRRSGAPGPELLLDLMLPGAVSYGACTNRVFLVAAALGCTSVHRRDSDGDYQLLDGRKVFPIDHELRALGRRAGDVAADATAVTRNELDPAHGDRPVVLVGGSFIGELSVDVGGIRELDPAVYHDVVGLWAPPVWSDEEKRELVEESFTGGGTEPFRADETVLGPPDIRRVDMCNLGLDHRVYERLPLPPATDTIGSDYFLLHVVLDAGLPGVVHNRHIVNYYTSERRTGPGFTAYQVRFAKFLLSMLYLHPVYGEMMALGEDLLDERYEVRTAPVLDSVRRSADWDPAENVRRLDVLDRSYRRLGGTYADFADHLAPLRERLLAEARADAERFALLIDAWGALVAAAHAEPAAATAEPGAAAAAGAAG
ncbi:DUF6271 family protein [Kitasatospora sp. NPDC057904]|uniref:DUF6271 family protein n=1 Tax=Kitasatospora sp. NPDC057904 TaxID=3346275 RepID=UPI0036DC4EF4